MSFYGSKDFGLEVALGHVPGYGQELKFGKAMDADTGIVTDIWDGADGATGTPVWVAPTTARVHNIVSSDAADAAAGTGMRTVRVFGLTGWDAKQVSEDVILDGVTPVATVNSYVIIHRLEGLTFGSVGSNVGVITVTAVTDATITAAILALNGQTQMAILGIPSVQTFVMTDITSTLLRVVGAGAVGDVSLLVESNADQADAGFVVKEVFRVDSADAFVHNLGAPVPFAGPAIIKAQIITNTNNTQATATINGFLVDN